MQQSKQVACLGQGWVQWAGGIAGLCCGAGVRSGCRLENNEQKGGHKRSWGGGAAHATGLVSLGGSYQSMKALGARAWGSVCWHYAVVSCGLMHVLIASHATVGRGQRGSAAAV